MTIETGRRIFWVTFMTILVTSMIFIGINATETKKGNESEQAKSKLELLVKKEK